MLQAEYVLQAEFVLQDEFVQAEYVQAGYVLQAQLSGWLGSSVHSRSCTGGQTGHQPWPPLLPRHQDENSSRFSTAI